MPLVLSLVPLALLAAIGFLYVWYLRIAARWTVKIALSRKLAWVFVAIVLLGAIAVRIFVPTDGNPIAAVVGAAVHLGFGAYFFGNFAVDKSGTRPGISGGLKITAVAMGLLLVTTVGLFFTAAALQAMLAAS